MALFKKKKTMDASKSKVLDKPKLITGANIDKKQMEEIVRTTDSMQVVASSFRNAEDSDSQRVEEASKALLRSYDLAVRKISSTYEEIIETKKVVSSDFLTVQIMIRDYEKNHNIDAIAKTINTFAEEFEQQIANGRSVKLDEKLIIEPTDYVSKMIPIARYVTDGYVNVNTVSWEEIAKALHEGAVISSADIETIQTLVEAIMTNIDNGYYVKFGNIVIARVRPESPDLMVLFSKETIARLNKVYSGDRLRRRSKVLSKTNYIASFKDSKEKALQTDQNLAENLERSEAEGNKKQKAKINSVLDREDEIKDKLSKKVEDVDKKNKAMKENPLEDQTIEGMDVEDQILEKFSKKDIKKNKKAEKKEALKEAKESKKKSKQQDKIEPKEEQVDNPEIVEVPEKKEVKESKKPVKTKPAASSAKTKPVAKKTSSKKKQTTKKVPAKKKK